MRVFGRVFRLFAATLLLVAGTQALGFPSRPSDCPVPSASGASSFSASSTKAIDDLVQANILAKNLPGAVVVIGHAGRIVFFKSYGMRDACVPMTRDTIFDMASMTKVLATAPSVMRLEEQGRLRLDDPVRKYLPAFAARGKQKITIRELLTHTSGLEPDLSLTDAWSGKQNGLLRAFASRPMSPPGAVFRYSDINFIVLGALVEKLSGVPLDEYAEKYIFQPLGLEDTRFLPPAEWKARIAPTQVDEHGVMMQGVVHDPTARRMGGVAGHAGLFSDASDVAVYAQSLLDRLQGRPSRFPLKRATLEQMITPLRVSGPRRTTQRGLGWDIDSVYSSPRGNVFPVGSFGHTGFTGTSLWMDPASDTYVIILANAVHPHGHTNMSPLRSGIATIAAEAVSALPAANRVQTGIDVLEADHFSELAALAKRHGGRLRLGLLTNQTGMDAQGRRTADILAHAAAQAVPGLELKLLFSPEHGITGALDKSGIPNSTDAASGLPILSLYGATDQQRRPALDTMRQLDAVVIDLEDVGVRFYTYETLVRYFLEAAGHTGTEIMVLDRPNPLSGAFVQGPRSDPGRESYVNAMPIPVRHGMTLGELAHYFNGEARLGAALTVVPMRQWRRPQWFDETGLVWIDPSPNLHSLEAATLYPALGLIETTNLSVGRGTATPFAFIGAPWISDPVKHLSGRGLARYLAARHIPGVSFAEVSFTPLPPYPFANQRCDGVRILVNDRDAVDMPELGLEIAAALRHLYGAQFDIAKMDRLLLNRSVLDALLSGKDPKDIAQGWEKDLAAFDSARRPYLLYSQQWP